MVHRKQFSVGSFLSNTSEVEEELESFLTSATENNATRQATTRQQRKKLCVWVTLSAVAIFTILAFAASFTNHDASIQSYWPLRTSEGQAYTEIPTDNAVSDDIEGGNSRPSDEDQIEVLKETVVEEQLEQEEIIEAVIEQEQEQGSTEEPVVQSADDESTQPEENLDALSKEEEAEEVLPTALKIADAPQATQGISVENELIDAFETEDDLSSAAVVALPAVAAVQFIDTHPPIPADRSDRGDKKYLAYLPHSGFHNARIELSNALMVAHLTNRTLVLPSVRLGSPLAWSDKPHLEERLQRMQKDRWVAKCRPRLEELEGEKVDKKDFCFQYLHYTEVAWSMLSNLDALPETITLTPRFDYSLDYFTRPKPNGLGLDPSSIHSFPDEERYGIRIYDSPADKQGVGKYKQRYDIADLTSGEFEEKDLLYFGSMFGSGRVRLIEKSNRLLQQQMINAFVFRSPLLDPISHEIVQRMGGRGSYVAIHARVGDGGFRRQAAENMQQVFKTFASQAFGLHTTQIAQLFAANKDLKDVKAKRAVSPSMSSDFSHTDGLQLEDFTSTQERQHLHKRQTLPAYASASDLPIAKSLKCRGQLYTDPRMMILNRPIYMATDSHVPTTDVNLAVFFNTFPCIFILADFAMMTEAGSDPVPSLANLENVRSQQDGLKLAKFLYPFLEAEVASRGEKMIGTAGSTFSTFAAHTLHDVYMKDVEQDKLSRRMVRKTKRSH